jgi:hypothetical protein
MINYHGLGPNKRLYQIVVAGSHDAGITSGKKNEKTQSLGIGDQARAGVRVFDLRIKAFATDSTVKGVKMVEMRAYHGSTNDAKKSRAVFGIAGDSHNIVRSEMKTGMGVASEDLRTMLSEAKAFVSSQEGSTEFLILKFDKCTNWSAIAQQCVRDLGDRLYTDGGNLNRKTLAELAGRVIVLFSAKGLKESTIGTQQGILCFKNLTEEGSGYSADFPGLQYFGKGGTTLNPFANKFKANIKKQTKLMTKAAEKGNEEIIGMMYWTTTGLTESIKKRNDGMWDDPGKARLRRLWEGGLGEFVDDRVTMRSPNPLAEAQNRLGFFPNIVMIDFADSSKCQAIYDLNQVAAHALVGIG